MQLTEVLQGVETRRLSGPTAVDIQGVCYDSRQAGPGSLFAAVPGEHVDGHRFIDKALAAGAVAVLSERPAPPGFAATWVQALSVRRALAQAAASFYRHPARHLKVIGVTGTNGKTTTAYLLESILKAAGRQAGLFGTVEYHTASGVIAAAQTTPEAVDLQRFLAELRQAGAGWAVMEVSSHGLALERVYGIPFAAAVFTNLARDHLDFHKTFDAYFEAKQQLFLGCGAAPPPLAVLNADEPRTEQLKPACRGKVILFGSKEKGAVVFAQEVELAASGTRFLLQTPAGSASVVSRLVGRSNLSNLLAAAATAHGLGLPVDTIAAGLNSLQRVPGRFEQIDLGQPFTVVVDFAHTDLAFTNLLETARALTQGRVLIVFGSGGDRDRSKRPILGEIAGRLADQVVLTTDNPRSEDPLRTIQDTVVGVEKAGGNCLIEPDREKAFEKAFALARAGDIVLLAGKGHQTTQVYRERVEPWSELEAAQRALARLGYASEKAAPANSR